MMHLFVNTATSAAVQELDRLAISGLIRTKTLFNAYTMIFKIEGCLLIAFPCIYFLILVLCSYVLIQFVISNRRQIIRIKNSTEIFRTLKSNL